MLDMKKLKINLKLLKELDLVLILSLVVILSFGLVNIYSATRTTYKYYFVTHQIVWILVSTFVVYIILTIPYSSISHCIEYLYWFNIILLIYTSIFTKTVNGAKVWIQLGSVSIEPGEFARITLILILAKKIQEMDGQINTLKNLSVLCFYVALPIVLLLIAPDMGLVLIIFFAVLLIFFISNLDLKILFTGLITLFVCIALVWNSGLIKEYQKQRLTSFLDQESDPYGINLQLKQSKIAIGSGGLLGQGFTKGAFIQGSYIPESHTDFIFAVIGNEWGFLGSISLLGMYFIVIFRIVKISKDSKDIFGKVICVGVSGALIFSIIQNIGMTIGIMPISGITLPFVSYGGSSILANSISMGFALNVGMRKKKINF